MPWRKRIKEKWPYLVMYLSFILGGAVAMFLPSDTVLSAINRSLAYVWAGALVGGGTLAFTGCVRGGLAGENIGIPLCSGGNWIFAVIVFSNSDTAIGFAIGMIFCGMGIGILARWLEVRKLLKTSIDLPRRRRE